MTERLKGVMSFLGRVLLSVGLLAYIFSKIDTRKTIEVLTSADLSYIVYAGLVFLFINGVLLGRWFLFIKALDLTASAWDVVRFFFIGLFGNLFLPSAVGGDFLKILGLCRHSRQKPRVVASVLLDRLSGFASIVLVAVGSFLIGYRLIGDPVLAVPIVLMGAGSASVAAVLFNQRLYAFGCRIFKPFPRFQKSLMSLHYDVMLLKDRPWEGVKAVLISCFSQGLLVISYYLVARGLHQQIDFIYFLVFVPIICVASSFPSLGGLGIREAGSAYLFARIGVDSGVAVSLTLINFLFVVIIGLLGGGFYVSTLFGRRIQPDASVAVGPGSS